MKSLSLAWTSRLNTSLQGAIIGGKGPEPAPGAVLNANIKATPLIVNGMLYLATPNNAYALDARTGRQLWHYYWKSLGGSTIGNRGLGMWGNYLFLDTPDQHLVSLEAATGKERWNQQKADYRGDLYATTAPTVIGNRVFTPAGGDYTDVPGWLESRDPETGALQWKWYATPRAGEAGIESWPNAFAAERGGAAPWQPVTYDPELNLIYVGTGNPQPVLIGDSRPGDNLWTCSIVALHVETGKMAWYFQVSPHDTHDWDATQTPVLIDAVVNGQRRKLLAQASRNGMFFLLDRVTGEKVLSTSVPAVGELVAGLQADRRADSGSEEGTANRRRARVASQRRRDQLGAAVLQPADRSLLRQHRRRLRRPLPRHRRRSGAERLRRRRRAGGRRSRRRRFAPSIR